MKQVRVLQAVFEGELPPDKLPAFRGAIVEKVGREHTGFHNHDQQNGYLYQYPNIQYKRIGKQPCLMCVNEGVEEVQHLFLQNDWDLWIHDDHYPLRIDSLNINQFDLKVHPDRFFHYRIRNWLALNQKNHEKYQKLTGLREQIAFLERILTGNILSFARGIGWEVEERIELEIKHIQKERPIPFKNQQLLAFDLSFWTNVFLPHHIGLGKGASLGFGVVGGIKKNKWNKKQHEEKTTTGN